MSKKENQQKETQEETSNKRVAPIENFEVMGDSSSKEGCIKRLAISALVGFFLYIVAHIYFLWQPVGSENDISTKIINANVAGLKFFPALKSYTLEHIDGREKILAGEVEFGPVLKERLARAIQSDQPVTFTEYEVNAWLSKRVTPKQTGIFGYFMDAKAVWIDFKDGEVEFILERHVAGQTHISSVFMQFETLNRGYRITRNGAHVGQVTIPGGFQRLVMPTFSNLASELSDELKFYHDKEIHDIKVSDGKITFDPRSPDER